MNTQHISFCTLALPFVCLGTMGCSEAEVPVDPIGQFDDGTFEIFDSSGVLIGAIYAHHDLIDITNSYEYWKLHPASGAMNCNDTSHCNLAGKVIRPSTTTTFGKFDDWLNNKAYRFMNPWFLRATYSKHVEDADLACDGTLCTYMPSSSVPTTPISIFPPGAYEYGRDVVIVTNSPSGIVETWFMAAFIASSSRPPDDGITFSQTIPADLPCSIACAASCTGACTSTLRVDVTYQKCTNAPTNTEGC